MFLFRFVRGRCKPGFYIEYPLQVVEIVESLLKEKTAHGKVTIGKCYVKFIRYKTVRNWQDTEGMIQKVKWTGF